MCVSHQELQRSKHRWKKKIGRKTHGHTHTQGPAWHASGGLRWINLQVAGWVSTAGAAAPPARNWNGNPAAEPHIGERFPCQEIGKNLHVNEKFFSCVRINACVNVHMLGFTVDWLYLFFPVHKLEAFCLYCQINGRSWEWVWWGAGGLRCEKTLPAK